MTEDRHEAGASFLDAVRDAGMMRLRPILIAIAATTLALILVPTLYAFFVLDLKAIDWADKPGTTC